MRHDRRRLASAALSLLLASCGRQSSPSTVPLAGGDGGGLPRSEAAAEHVDGSALRGAVAAAMQSGARGFLVARHGHLLHEEFASGARAVDLVDGGGMAQTLVALAAGVAVADGRLTADTGHFDAASMANSIAAATGLAYVDYVSQHVWQPLNSASGRFVADGAGVVRADCCLAARAGDWLRLGIVLLQKGNFEGATIVPAAWVAGMRRPLADDPSRGFGIWLPVNGRDPEFGDAQPFATRDLYFLRGADGTRLWLAPSLQLAVLYLAASGAAPVDHTELVDRIIRAVEDRAQESPDQSLLQQLVPGH